ncbi:hypothetical protein GDO81_013487 [Engystomops pustulosus]|uniref:Uncharacterized protein n=1 Tax=Engystomops pustulosus TaxID=76066 RepID=A0AAV7B450_ENGPU|nr:hypothetical protein GDO81_013487 [Engystomops pustulosus]
MFFMYGYNHSNKCGKKMASNISIEIRPIYKNITLFDPFKEGFGLLIDSTETQKVSLYGLVASINGLLMRIVPAKCLWLTYPFLCLWPTC